MSRADILKENPLTCHVLTSMWLYPVRGNNNNRNREILRRMKRKKITLY